MSTNGHDSSLPEHGHPKAAHAAGPKRLRACVPAIPRSNEEQITVQPAGAGNSLESWFVGREKVSL